MFCNESSDKSKNNTHWLRPNDGTAKKFDLLIRALDKKEYLVIIRDNFCFFCIKTYVVTPHLNRLGEKFKPFWPSCFSLPLQ